MRIDTVSIRYISHCTFLLDLDGIVLLTDPYFCGSFEWEGKVETHLQVSPIRPHDFKKCDYVFISHDHGDHFDPDAIRIICQGTGARVLASQSICAELRGLGMEDSLLVPVAEEQPIEAGRFSLIPLGNYDRSFDEHGGCNKYSLLIQSNGNNIWYSGDNHDMPPNLLKYHPDVVICWTIPHTLERLRAVFPDLCDFILMHCDRHKPGDFWCSKDVQKERTTVQEYFPNTNVHVLERIPSLINGAWQGSSQNDR